MPEEKTTLTCHFDRSEKSAEGKIQNNENITNRKQLRPKKKDVKKIYGHGVKK